VRERFHSERLDRLLVRSVQAGTRGRRADVTPTGTVALLDASREFLRGHETFGSGDVRARDSDCKPAVPYPERAIEIAT